MVKFRRTVTLVLSVFIVSQVIVILNKFRNIPQTADGWNKTIAKNASIFKYRRDSGLSIPSLVRPSGKMVNLNFQDKVLDMMDWNQSDSINSSNTLRKIHSYDVDVTLDGTTGSVIVPISGHNKNNQRPAHKATDNKRAAVEKFISGTTKWVGDQDKEAEGPRIVLFRFSPGYHASFDRNVDMRRCQYNDCTVKLVPKLETMYKAGAVPVDADAVLFQGNMMPFEAPLRQDGNQVWIFFNMECPWYITRKTYMNNQWDSSFNWTMTYRLDSDFPNPYGLPVLRSDPPIYRDYGKIFRQKTKSVLWFVSHCDTSSKREVYAQHLRQYIDMDVYGSCTQRKTTCYFNERDSCLKDEVTHYKFYIAFENTLCKDYVTEKFYTILNLDVIPVVRGGANYSAIAPPGTYINTDDFKSPEDLAKFLNWLGNNEEEYTKYLKAKDKYGGIERAYQRSFCSLCEKLHNVEENRRTYSSMQEWWHESSCRKPSDVSM